MTVCSEFLHGFPPRLMISIEVEVDWKNLCWYCCVTLFPNRSVQRVGRGQQLVTEIICQNSFKQRKDSFFDEENLKKEAFKSQDSRGRASILHNPRFVTSNCMNVKVKRMQRGDMFAKTGVSDSKIYCHWIVTSPVLSMRQDDCFSKKEEEK